MRVISARKLIGGVLAVFLLIILDDTGGKKYTGTFKVTSSENSYLGKKAEITRAGIDKKMFAGIEAKEYNILFDSVNKTYCSPNRVHNIRSNFQPGSWSLQNRIQQNNPGWKLKFITDGVYADGNCIARPARMPSVVTYNNRIDFEYEKFTEQYINNNEGVRQNFIIKSAPKNTRIIVVRLQYSGMQAAEIAENAISFHDANSTLTYTDIRVWDAAGKNAAAKIQLKGSEINLIAEVDNATFPLTIDPIIAGYSSPDVILNSEGFPHPGNAVAGLGDINGGGYGDVLAGSDDNGVAFIYYGSPEGITKANTDTLKDPYGSFGWDVLALGDINADGYNDFTVSIGFDDRVVVFYGSASGVNLSHVDTLKTIESGVISTKDIAVDVNGDGYRDIIRGASAHSNTDGSTGAAFIYYGSASGINTTPGYVIESKMNDPNSGFASAMAAAGDINNDGYEDFIIGVPGYNKGQLNEGIALLFSGSASGVIASPDTIESNQEEARLGGAMAGGCDLNADGFDDVIIGAPGYDHGQIDEGIVLIYYGSGTGLNKLTVDTLENNKPGERLGNKIVCNKKAGNLAKIGIVPGNQDYSMAFITTAIVYSGSSLGINKKSADTLKLDKRYSSGDDQTISISFSERTNDDDFTDVVVSSSHQYVYNTGSVIAYYGPFDNGGNTQLVALEGNQAGALYGASVSGAGDVNGDGYSDLIVGVPDYDNGEADEGSAFLYYGSSTGIGATSIMLESNQANAHFGAAVSGAGDVNGDGYADIIIAAPNYDKGETDEGVVFVYMGSSSGIGTTPAALLESNQANALSGKNISRAGDINGDGFSDILIGVPLYDNGQTDEGVVFVYTGSSAGINNVPAIILERDQANAQFGASVAAAADINADGYSDVVIGAPFYDNGETDEGAAFIYHGSIVGLSNTVAPVIESNQANAQMGISVSGAGDVNGDGYSDVIIAAPYFDNGETDEGAVWVYHGSATGIVTPYASLLEGNQNNAQFGYSVAGAGDNNADGYSDIVIGAPYFDNGQTDEGAAFVYYGAAPGINNTPVVTLESNQADAHYGTWVNLLGDNNGDGYSDVVAGAPQYDNGEFNEGAIFFYNGSGSETGATAAYMFNIAGTSISGAGDLNGDGFDDLIVTNDALYIYYGSQNGISNTPDVTLTSAAAGATAGDVNGDGYGDMMVNISITQTPWEQISGVVIFYGSASGININSTDTLEGYDDISLSPYPSMFGYVKVAGDVNGDGFSDVFVAVPGIGSGWGAVYVYYGSATGVIKTAGTQLIGISVKTYFGANLIMPGDINGDGYCDVAVGDGAASTGGLFQNGAFMVYYGSSSGFITNGAGVTTPDDIVSGIAEEELFGGISPAGDVNGDGFADIKAQDINGGRYIYLGSAAGINKISTFFPEIGGGGIADVNGDGYADAYLNGNAIGDINGDGFTDIALNTANNAGIYFGNNSAGMRRTMQLFNTSTTIPIQQLNIAQPDFAIGLFAKNPQGRTKGKLVWETRAQGQPFSSSSPITNSTQFTAEQEAFSDLDATGILLTDNVDKIAFQTKVRARVKYDPVTSLSGQVYSRWIYPPGFFGAMGMNAAALPVELIDFTATPVDNKRVRLYWETASEINNNYFSVERASDAEHWYEIAKLNGSGNISTNISYQVWDEHPYKGISYYRLKQVDKDGKFSYSEIRKVSITDNHSMLRIYPNPGNGILTVEGNKAELTRLQLYNVEGKNLTPSIKIKKIDDMKLLLDISRLTPGIYYLQTTNETKKIIRQ